MRPTQAKTNFHPKEHLTTATWAFFGNGSIFLSLSLSLSILVTLPYFPIRRVLSFYAVCASISVLKNAPDFYAFFV